MNLITLIKVVSFVDDIHEKILFNIILMVLFTGVYKMLSEQNPESFSVNKKLTLMDSFYFTNVVHFTLGFGDIYPTTTMARLFVILHIVLFWMINIINPQLSRFLKRMNEGKI